MERSCFLFLPCLGLLLLQCHMAGFVVVAVLNISTDQSALLALKARISYDPHNVLATNWSTGTSVCSWVGVTCGSSHLRVVALNLSYMGLAGTIPPHLGNLSFLLSLSITNNSFHGSLPNQLSRLYRLQHLSFGFNGFSGEIPSWMYLLVKLQVLYLNDNNFIGSIPQSLNLSSLQKVDLSYNQLSGSIPSSILNQSNLQKLNLGANRLSDWMPSIAFNMSSLRFIGLHSNKLSGGLPRDIFNYLPNLQHLDLSDNQFHGGLPSSLFNCKQLQHLLLQNNNFTGAIPIEIGNLRNLEIIDIGFNNFSGQIPFQIFNISSIKVIGMHFNYLSGNLPSNLGLFLPNLQNLLLERNRLSGSLPSSISNASQLIWLDLSKNSFSGLIPRALANLRLLQCLNIGSNNFTIESSTQEFNFFSLLSNLVDLRHLGLSSNPLNDILPNSIGNLSTLERLFISDCNMKGKIPKDIGNLSNLYTLGLGFNKFSGFIPTTMARLYDLQGFSFRNNRLEGSIPLALCHLTSLYEMDLSGNELFGTIPACLNNLTFLRLLYLDSNKLTSMIPLSLWSLTYILNINLSSNFLSGFLPFEIAKLKVLSVLDLSSNKLSGDIPLEIGSLKDIVHLSLANNRLEGSIPDSFGELRSLEFLDLSSNHLSGEIPKSLEALPFLKYLNVSLNDGLCGASKLQLPLCKEGVSQSKKTIATCTLRYVLPAIGLTMLAVALLLTWTRWRERNVKFQAEMDLSPQLPWRRISYQDLVQATEGFSSTNFLGEGSFGSVYRGKLADGMSVAIKVLNSKEGALISFDVESKILSNIRHRNLIKIISTCSNMDFRALILEYMLNGSLEKWLHSHNYYLNILQRLNIMIDVASALEYLHYEHSTAIVHCDLKPSNVLLDEDMAAHVADFGIAKLFDDAVSMRRTMTLATIGYMAPEYGSQGIVSTKGDVYSYGILLLETFTRKRPTDDMFVGGLSLKTWVEESLHLSVLAVVDPNLLEDGRKYTFKQDCMSSIMELGLSCCAESPKQRMNMRSVVVALNKIKLKFLQDNQGN